MFYLRKWKGWKSIRLNKLRRILWPYKFWVSRENIKGKDQLSWLKWGSTERYGQIQFPSHKTSWYVDKKAKVCTFKRDGNYQILES